MTRSFKGGSIPPFRFVTVNYVLWYRVKWGREVGVSERLSTRERHAPAVRSI